MKLSTLDPLAIGGLSVVVKVGRGGVKSLALAKPTSKILASDTD